MDTPKIKVFIVDDHEVVRYGLKLLLKDEPTIEIVGEATDGRDLFRQLVQKKGKPLDIDLILMDINMPHMDGLTATRKIKKRFPFVKIIMLTIKDQRSVFTEAVEMGANGFLSKNTSREEIITAIKKVYIDNDFAVSADLDQGYSTDSLSTSVDVVVDTFFTEREREIICMISKEISLDDIAIRLKLSPLILRTYHKNILSKLGVATNVGIAREAVARKLCNPVSSQI